MKKFKLNKEFPYSEIEKEVDKFEYRITEHGPEYIGENFIVLEDDYDTVCSFVMTSYNSAAGAYYTCIYNDAYTKNK